MIEVRKEDILDEKGIVREILRVKISIVSIFICLWKYGNIECFNLNGLEMVLENVLNFYFFFVFVDFVIVDLLIVLVVVMFIR